MESNRTLSTKKSRVARSSLNYHRGMFFLNLAAEQVRSVDSAAADRLLRRYLEPLSSAFEQSVKNMDYDKLDSSAKAFGSPQQWHGEVAWDYLKRLNQLPVAPPGFSLGQLGLFEVEPCITSKHGTAEKTQHECQPRPSHSVWSSKSLLEQLNAYKEQSPVKATKAQSQPALGTLGSNYPIYEMNGRRDYGPIAPPKPSDVLAARKARDSNTSSIPSSYAANRTWESGRSLARSESAATVSKPHSRSSDSIPRWWESESSASGVALETVLNSASSGLDGTVKPQSSNGATGGVPMARLDSAVEIASQDSAYWSFRESCRRGSTSEEATNYTNNKAPEPSFDTEYATEDEETLITEDNANVEQDKNETPSTTGSSWAKIAAISNSSVDKSNPHITLTLASPNSWSSHPITVSTAPKTRPETESAQLRVVWLVHLPRFFKPRHVSSQIIEGPIMSILLQKDAHESLPGLSACVIFMNAADMSAYLENNNHCDRTHRQIGPTKYARYFRKAESIKHTNKTDSDDSQRTDISIMKGSPYPMDTDISLQSMLPPTNARRRLKWSRSRLFYDVSIRQFKRDVMALVGSKANVELFHFYNPGECTVVFASVGVAAACLAGFEEWRRERANGWDSIMGTPATEITTLEEEGRAGGLMPGRMDGKKGRYEGVDVAYVRDFNEAKPESLWSQYSKDGRLRPSSRMDGCEGLFEGPEV